MKKLGWLGRGQLWRRRTFLQASAGWLGTQWFGVPSERALAKDAKTISVLCDPTIAMPILVTALSQTGTKALKQRRRPQFSFGRELMVSFG